MPAANPLSSGTEKSRLRLLALARRQAITGPTPVRNSKSTPKGPFTLLKNGGPPGDFSPPPPFDQTGKTVPQKVAKARPTNTQLFNRKAASRESSESSSFSLLSSGRR